MTTLLAGSMILGACGNGNDTASNSPSASPSVKPEAAASASPNAIDTSKAVTLKMVMLGPKPVDYDLVFGEINKVLGAKVNATLQTEFLDWSDWKQKYPLKFAANEDFDIIYTANWALYTNQANKDGFLELTDDMLSKYAPQTWKAMPKVSWDQARVKGKVYMIPQNKSNEFIDKLVLYREDWRLKYNLPPITDGASFAQYLETIAKNEKGVTPFGLESTTATMHMLDTELLVQKNNWDMVEGPFAFKTEDAAGKVFNIYETAEFKELLSYYKTLADNGGWSRNVLTNKSNAKDDFKAGKIAAMAHTLSSVSSIMADMNKAQPDMKVALADLVPNSHKTSAISTQNGVAIHATSKNPERALMVLDLLQNDRQIHDLIMYGIEGTHYTAGGNDKFTKMDKFANFNSFTNWGWSSPLNRVDTSYPQAAQDIEKQWLGKVYHYKLETFVFDNSKVVNEVANVSNVMVRYGVPLEYGLVKDLDKGLAELHSQLKAAGVDKIQAEIQSQIDAFLASN
ncbi:MAG: hypothetical protein K0R57_5509 [Paenibacillaceae bacterium]|nr:hypothetical protein [Paenibacillaceae bacterium]